jgi:hypothetical protein
VNRAERRRLRGPVRELEDTRLAKEREITAQALEVCAWIRASTEPVGERRDLVAQAIADMRANPVTALFAGPALEELGKLHDELAARARAH